MTWCSKKIYRPRAIFNIPGPPWPALRKKLKFDLLIDPSTISCRLRPSFDGIGRLSTFPSTVNREVGWGPHGNGMTAPSNRQIRLRRPALVKRKGTFLSEAYFFLMNKSYITIYTYCNIYILETIHIDETFFFSKNVTSAFDYPQLGLARLPALGQARPITKFQEFQILLLVQVTGHFLKGIRVRLD